jgi:hypothetical protein
MQDELGMKNRFGLKSKVPFLTARISSSHAEVVVHDEGVPRVMFESLRCIGTPVRD